MWFCLNLISSLKCISKLDFSFFTLKDIVVFKKLC